MLKKIKILVLISLAIPTIIKTEDNIAMEALWCFYAGLNATTVGPSAFLASGVVNTDKVPTVSPLVVFGICFDDKLSVLEKTALSGSVIAGFTGGISAWYMAGQYMSNAMCHSDIGRYAAVIPVSWLVAHVGAAYLVARFVSDFQSALKPASA